MTIEDRLSHDERLRLECVAQANIAMSHRTSLPNDLSRTLTLLRNAARIESFVRDGALPAECRLEGE